MLSLELITFQTNLLICIAPLQKFQILKGKINSQTFQMDHSQSVKERSMQVLKNPTSGKLLLFSIIYQIHLDTLELEIAYGCIIVKLNRRYLFRERLKQLINLHSKLNL